MMTTNAKTVKVALLSAVALIILFSATASANNYALENDLLYLTHNSHHSLTDDEPGPGVGGWDSVHVGIFDDEPGPGVGGWD